MKRFPDEYTPPKLSVVGGSVLQGYCAPCGAGSGPTATCAIPGGAGKYDGSLLPPDVVGKGL